MNSTIQTDASCSLGVGVAIGIAVMLTLGGICILLVLIFRERVASCLIGKKKKYKQDAKSSDHKNNPRKIQSKLAKTQITHIGAGRDGPEHYYDGLNEDKGGASPAYEDVQIYQNT